MYVSNKDLGFIRGEVQKFMIDTVTIYNVSTTYSGDGFPTVTRTEVATSKGQLSNPTGRERELIAALINEGTENVETLKLTLPYATSLELNQEIGTADGKFWDIVHIGSSVTLTAALEVLLSRKVVST